MENIKKILDAGNLIIGMKKVKELLMQDQLDEVFLASNPPESLKLDLEKYSPVAGTPVKLLEISNEELGVLCRKPYSISVVAKKK